MSKNRNRTFPHRDVTICLDGSSAADRETLLAKQRRTPAEAKQLKDIETRMKDSLLTIRVVGVSRAEYAKIQRAHPAATPMQAFNPDTFFYDFIYKTGFEVDGVEVSKLSDWDRSEWDAVTEDLTEGEWSDLAQAVHDMNVKRVETAFLSRGSDTTEPSSQNSEQPDPGE